MNYKQLFILAAASAFGCSGTYADGRQDAFLPGEQIRTLPLLQVKVEDGFWSPKMQTWSQVASRDVFNKFEGRFVDKPEEIGRNDSFANFDRVAAGVRDGHHAGLPWFDGLIYETIRGVSDLMALNPDPEMVVRIDGYIDRIEAAQKSDPDGFINTFTELRENNHRWGFDGGFLREQHDVYNAGMLFEAAVHYYQATGKTKLLEVATRFANYMTEYMGPAPKKNVVPAHSGPEEALMKVYWLYKNNPGLAGQVKVPVKTEAYRDLVTYWIDYRGRHCGYPLWKEWGNDESTKWIRANKYTTPEFGDHSRPTWGDYAQDRIPVLEQKTIEGHAVRATLLATGIAAATLDNGSKPYLSTLHSLWDNMVGKRVFISGGVGAVHFDEKFGDDYFLPNDAYLETCAAVGAGFFSQRMNQLTADAKYMDEFERVIYNGVLTGISLEGNKYTYQNPLNAHNHERWNWHPCPCCPPMFLKIMSAVPGFIYGEGKDGVYVNLFIGSSARLSAAGTEIALKQETKYPWNGDVAITVYASKALTFPVRIRVPGWVSGQENPFGLYISRPGKALTFAVNGKAVECKVVNGYAEINREWNNGDTITFVLPVEPRVVKANDKVEQLRGQVSLAAGPLVYSLESCDNASLDKLNLSADVPMRLSFKADLLDGVNVIEGVGMVDGKEVKYTAVPYYAIGNRPSPEGYRTWIQTAAK